MYPLPSWRSRRHSGVHRSTAFTFQSIHVRPIKTLSSSSLHYLARDSSSIFHTITFQDLPNTILHHYFLRCVWNPGIVKTLEKSFAECNDLGLLRIMRKICLESEQIVLEILGLVCLKPSGSGSWNMPRIYVKFWAVFAKTLEFTLWIRSQSW